MNKKSLLGGYLAIFSAVIGLVGHFILFEKWYVAGMSAESAEPGCEILLKYIHPALADLGLLAAAVFIVAAYGSSPTKMGLHALRDRHGRRL